MQVIIQLYYYIVYRIYNICKYWKWIIEYPGDTVALHLHFNPNLRE